MITDNSNEPLIIQAYKYMRHYHQGQKRLDGEDYYKHPVSVANRLGRPDDEILYSIALCHDLIEDTEITYEILKKDFGKEIADGVLIVSKPENMPYEDYIHTIKRSGNKRAIAVKIADLEDNLDSIDNISDNEKRERLKKRYQKALEVLNYVEIV